MRYSTVADWIEDTLPNPVRRKKDYIEDQFAQWSSWIVLKVRSRRVFLLRYVLPAMVMLAAFPLGYISVRNPLFAILFIVLMLMPVGLIIAQEWITRFEWAPVFILFAAIFTPIQLPTGTSSVLVDSLVIALIFVGNWIAQMILVDKRNTLKPSPLNLPFYLFAIINIFTLIWSNFFSDPLVDFKGRFIVVQVGSVMVNIMLMATLLLVANKINDIKQLKWMVKLMLIGGAIGYISRFGGIRLNLHDGQTVNDGGFFTMWVAAIGVSMFLFNGEWSWKWRILALVIGFSIQMSRFLQEIAWVAGWFPGFLMLGVLMVRRSKWLIPASMVAILIFGIINAEMLNEAFAEESEESGDTRLHAWETNWRITGNHVLFGTGQAAYINYYTSYFSEEGFQIQATHNTVLDLLAQNGFFGLFFVFWFLFALMLANFKVCVRFSGQRNFAEALANACFAGTVASTIAMAFGDWLFPYAYTQTIAGYDYIVYTWLFMGTGIALDNVIPHDETQTIV